MRPKVSPDLIAVRRRRSLSLLDEGLSLHEVARRVGRHASSVMRWPDEYEKRGEESFAVRFSPGSPPRLTDRNLKRFRSLLLKGVVANGYRTEIWTTKRIAEMIAREWRVRYQPDHIGRLMAKLGWTHQKLARRAASRNEDAIRRWVFEECPRVKKNTARLGAHLDFVDESGFLLIPTVRRTWVPRRMTPACRHPFRREKGLGDLGSHRPFQKETGRTLFPPPGGQLPVRRRGRVP